MDPIQTQELEVTWARTLRIWWSYVWRCGLYGGLLGLLLGFVGGVVVALMGRPDLSALVGGIWGYLGAIPISIIMLRNILRKRFPEFTVRLVRNVESSV
jgi:hypothetical protein